MYGDYTYDYGQIDSGAASGILAVGAVFWVFSLALIVLMIIALWKIFTKAGRPGWAAIIPVYNGWVFFEICGQKGWYILLSLIPVVGSIIVFVFMIMAYIKLAKAFGKETGFAVGMIFLPYVFLPILAFGKDNVYDASRINATQPNINTYSQTTDTNAYNQAPTDANTYNQAPIDNNTYNQTPTDTNTNNDSTNQMM